MTAPDLFGGETPLTMAAPAAEVVTLPTPLSPDQVTLFDLDLLTVAVPGQAERAKFDAAGVSPKAFKILYDKTSIRQIVTYWHQVDYVAVLLRFEKAMAFFKTDNHSDTVAKLLEFWEASQGAGACPGCDLQTMQATVARAEQGYPSLDDPEDEGRGDAYEEPDDFAPGGILGPSPVDTDNDCAP